MRYLRKSKNLVAGVGINDSETSVQEMEVVNGKVVKVWTCPYYQKWTAILNRCYREKQSANRFYEDVFICDEWKTFSKFKSWLDSQKDWDKNCIDKDLMSIITGIKCYSPDNCVIISKRLNAYLMNRYRVRGDLPLGVCISSKNRSKYRATINTGKWKELGNFSTPEQAHKAWQEAKLAYGRELLSEQTDERVIEGLTKILDNLADDIHNGRITEKLV